MFFPGCFYALKGGKKRFTSIISINQLATWATTPEAHGISAYWTHKINTTTNLLSFLYSFAPKKQR